MNTLIQHIRQTCFFCLFVFTLFFDVIIHHVAGFKGLDEAATVALLLLYAGFVVAGKHRIGAGTIATTVIFLFYLGYSFYLAYNSQAAIVADFLTQLRPYLAFFMAAQIAPVFSDAQKNLLRKICLCIWPFFIPIGFYGLINPDALNVIIGKDANYMATIVCLALVYLYCSPFMLKEQVTCIFMLAVGLLALHAGFTGFFLIAVVALFVFRDAKLLGVGWKTWMAVAVVFALTAYCTYNGVASYAQMAKTDNAVQALYHSTPIILRDFFPFGSGFASFASEASGEFYSQVYAAYRLNTLDSLTPDNWFAVRDAFYPSLAQFGVVGMLLHLFFCTYIGVDMLMRLKRAGDIRAFAVALLLLCFLFIENTCDAFFSDSKGFFVMMFLGMIAGRREVAVISPVPSVLIPPAPVPAPPAPENDRHTHALTPSPETAPAFVAEVADEEWDDEFDDGFDEEWDDEYGTGESDPSDADTEIDEQQAILPLEDADDEIFRTFEPLLDNDDDASALRPNRSLPDDGRYEFDI